MKALLCALPFALSGCLEATEEKSVTPQSVQGALSGTWPKPWKIEAAASFPEGLPSCGDLLAKARSRWDAHKRNQVPGTYVGSHAEGVEVFEIRNDGSFTQTFLRDGKQIYTQDGKWVREDDQVRFAPFMDAREPTKAWDSSTGAWMSLWDNLTDGIILSDCEGIYILKQD